MTDALQFEIEQQPNVTSCGPTCLHAIYRYYGDHLPLAQVIDEVPALEEGGTLGVLLGRHALARGYQVKIHTFNLSIFDPSWFAEPGVDLDAKLEAQARVKPNPRLRSATAAYRDFLAAGGRIHMNDLTTGLLRGYLRRGVPILTGLSATYLYQCKREIPATCEDDDILGETAGHFVVICGYDKRSRQALIADPYLPNPLSERGLYPVPIARAVCSILLGILTYDANLVIIQPGRRGIRKGRG